MKSNLSLRMPQWKSSIILVKIVIIGSFNLSFRLIKYDILSGSMKFNFYHFYDKNWHEITPFDIFSEIEHQNYIDEEGGYIIALLKEER